MKHPQHGSSLLDLKPTASREALRLIIDVFKDGHAAAADLRRTVDRLSAVELELELEAIEDTMLSQIASICGAYQMQEPDTPRN